MNVNELLNSTGADMEAMDGSFNNYENPELMSSEFFDSVLSLENNFEDGFFPSFEEDVLLSSDTSCHTDEVLSPRSFYSESDKSVCTEILDDSNPVINKLDDLDHPILMSILDEADNSIQIEEAKQIKIEKPVQKAPTKILIQNPNNKKFIAKPLITNQFKKSPKMKPQILKVQSVPNNGRPVLVPLSVKSIKFLNPSGGITNISSMKKRKIETQTVPCEVLSDDDTNVVSSTNSHYPALNLTSEEKRLLAKEGIQLPTHHPLTKNEERELKRIRRKIRNKISAQDSRKRKKEYVDGLEERVKRGSEENKNLLQRVRELQKQNKNLIAHVSKLQALICNSSTTKATPSTCLMVVLLSALLVSLPNLRLFENKQVNSDQEQLAIRRSLLSSPSAEEEGLNMEEFLLFKDEEEFEAKFGDAEVDNATDRDFSKVLEEMGKKYEGMHAENSSEKGIFGRVMDTFKSLMGNRFGNEIGGGLSRKGFIEPDIDDDYVEEPVMKRMRFSSGQVDYGGEGQDHDKVLTVKPLACKEQ